MNDVLLMLIKEQAAYIERLEKALYSYKSDIKDIKDILEGLGAKLEAVGHKC